MVQHMTLKEMIEAIDLTAPARNPSPPVRVLYQRGMPSRISPYQAIRAASVRNQNHPKKGDRIKVDPIRDIKDIERIKNTLAGSPRDVLLFTIGINTNLRASDIVALTVGQVRHLRTLEDLELREKKTGKLRRITLNQAVIDAIAGFLSTLPDDVDGSAPLFPSQRGNYALTVPSVSRMVKGWCRAVKLNGNYGSHSLRKTWGYHQRKTFGVDIPTLMECFNHSNQRQTLAYLCVQAEEVRQVYSHKL